jgi:hypothetical protein
MSGARGRSVTVAGGVLVVLVLSAFSACPKGSSGPTGTATLRLDNVPSGVTTLHFDPATKIVSLDVDGFGFAPSSAHAVHVHPGTCLDPQNAPSITLPDVTADAKGRLKSTVRTSQPVAGGIPHRSRLDVHGSSATPIMCTDLGNDPTAAKRLYPQPGEKPFGTATVTHKSGKVTVAFQLNALLRLTSHAVQIRTGSCKVPGAVKYKVDAIRADQNGAVNVTRTIKHPGAVPRTDWNLVLYEGPDTSSRPLLCGDIGPLHRVVDR